MLPLIALLFSMILTWPEPTSVLSNEAEPLTDWEMNDRNNEDRYKAEFVTVYGKNLETNTGATCIPTSLGEVPYLVEIWMDPHETFISHGVLVTNTLVLTALTRIRYGLAHYGNNLKIQLQPIFEIRGTFKNVKYKNIYPTDTFCFSQYEVAEIIPHPKAEKELYNFNFALAKLKKPILVKQGFPTFPLLDIGSTVYELFLKIRTADMDPKAGCTTPFVRPIDEVDIMRKMFKWSEHPTAPKIHRLVSIPFSRDCMEEVCESSLDEHLSKGKRTKLGQTRVNELNRICKQTIETGGSSMHLCMRALKEPQLDEVDYSDDSTAGLPVICEGTAVGMISRTVHRPNSTFWLVLTFLRIYPWLAEYRKDLHKALTYAPALQENHPFTGLHPDKILKWNGERT